MRVLGLPISRFTASALIYIFLTAFCLTSYSHWQSQSPINRLAGEERDYVKKLSDYLCRPQQSDVVLLGSSFFLVPTVYLEQQSIGGFYKAGTADYGLLLKVLRCDSAPYLEQRLDKLTGKPNQIANLAVAASNVSDYLYELEALPKAKTQTKLIVCGLSVRDFVQSFWKLNPQNNPSAKLFSNSQNIRAGKGNLPFSKLIQTFLVDVRYYFCQLCYPEISKLQSILTNDSKPLELPASPDQLTVRIAALRMQNGSLDSFIDYQLKSFESFVTFAQQHALPVIIVEEPEHHIWQGNPSSEQAKRIEEFIRSQCSIHHIACINLQNDFTTSDFEDDFHLDAKGGKKFFDKLASVLANRMKQPSSNNEAH